MTSRDDEIVSVTAEINALLADLNTTVAALNGILTNGEKAVTDEPAETQ